MPDIFVAKKESLPAPNSHIEPDFQTSIEEDKFKKGAAKHVLPGHKHNPFSAFCYFPDRVNFETKQSGEKIVLLVRRHFITNIRWIFISLIMISAPYVLNFFPILTFLPNNYQLIAILGWYLITLAFILEEFLTWFFDANILTDERIVDIEFSNLIYKQVSDTKIDKVQDVHYKTGGVIRTLFNYGDVHIQTASEVPTFNFLAVPKPDQIAKILQDLMLEEEQEKLEGRVR